MRGPQRDAPRARAAARALRESCARWGAGRGICFCLFGCPTLLALSLEGSCEGSVLRVGSAVGCHPGRSGRAPGANMKKHYDLEIPEDEIADKIDRDVHPLEPFPTR